MFRSYLLRAIRNEAHSLFRSRRRRQRRDVAAMPERFANDPIIDVDLRSAIAGLDLRQRSVLFLAYWEDMTEAAIAQTLGLSRGTVHRDLQRARDRLGKALQ
jgi:RNA polymerase sigma-70 factor (ECF subfamily)